MSWIDVTRPMDDELPMWPGREPPRLRWEASMADGAGFNASGWELSAHSGTHMDAPRHFVREGLTIDQVPIETFVGPCLVIDNRRPDGAPLDARQVTLARGHERLLIRSLQSDHRTGAGPAHAGLLTDDDAHSLVAAGLKLIGTDRLSVDDSVGEEFPLHDILLGAGCVMIEGLWLADVAEGEYDLIAAPLRFVGSEASPIRALLKPRPPR